jgi:hypothetical protein
MRSPDGEAIRAPVIRGGLVAAAVALLLVGAWIWPPLAVAVVWPLLLVVPGAALVGWGVRGRAPIASTGQVGLAIVLSVAVSAHLAWWLATVAGGYGREIVFLTAAMLAVPLPLVAARSAGSPRTVGTDAWRSVRRAVRRRRPAFGLATGAALVVGGVLARGLWQVDPDGVSVGGSNWSDLGVHLAIAQSVNAGNFPPQVPYFAGEPLVYHWFADFHAALLAESAGLFAVPVFVVHSALLAGALALLVHGLAIALLRDRWARRAAWLAAFLVVIGGGLGWIRLVGDLATGLGTAGDLLMIHAYDNEWLSGWPYFSIPSVMTTGLLVHRATTAGLPMLVGAVLLAVVAIPTARRRAAGSVDRERLIVLAGLTGALLAPFHFFFFPVVPALVAAWVALGRRLFTRPAVRLALLFATPYLLAVPFATAAFDQATGSGWLEPVLGWPTAPLDDGPGAVLFFYLTNLGLPFLLALASLVLVRSPSRVFLAVWIGLLFFVPNVVQVSYVSFDMNKYFQAMWIAVGIAAGVLLARWPAPVVAIVLAVSAISPTLSAIHHGVSQNFLLRTDELAAAEWIAANTPPRAVFVTDDWIIAPTDPAGRLRLTGFGPYVDNLGYDFGARQALVAEIRCGGDPGRSAALMAELGASYVIPTGGSGCAEPVDFGSSDRFEEAYRDGSLVIYRLSSAP